MTDYPQILSQGFVECRFGCMETGFEHRVFVSSGGAAPVILLHELPAISEELVDFAKVLVSEGFKVYLPMLIDGYVPAGGRGHIVQAGITICVRREFAALMRGDHTRAGVAWVKALARKASADHNNARVGVIGLCFTGGFALAAATEPVVAAAVGAEPSLPLFDDEAIDISPNDLQRIVERQNRDEVRLRAYRFKGDTISPCARMLRLQRDLGDSFEGQCLDDDQAGRHRHKPPHSVLALDFNCHGGQTQTVRDEVVAFLKRRLAGGPDPGPSMLPKCTPQDCPHHREPGSGGSGAAQT